MKKKFTIFVVLLAGIIYTGHAQGVQWIYQQKQEKKLKRGIICLNIPTLEITYRNYCLIH